MEFMYYSSNLFKYVCREMVPIKSKSPNLTTIYLISYLITDYRQISNSLQPKFISQTQIDFPLKCLKNEVSLKSLGFCKDNE